MSRQGFAKLIADYCDHTGLSGSAEKVLRGAPFKVDGVLIAVDWKHDRMPAIGFAHADIASIPMEHASSVCRWLLSENMSLHAMTGQSITMSPKSGRVLLSAHFSIKDTDATGLERLLVSMATTAQALRKECLQLSEPDRAAQDR